MGWCLNDIGLDFKSWNSWQIITDSKGIYALK